MPQFVEKWLEDLARQRLVREESFLQSEYPTFQASLAGSTGRGYRYQDDAGSCSLLLSIPSSRWFKPRMLWLNNITNVANRIQFYIGGSAADASASLPGIWIGPNATEFVALDCITIDADLYASTLASNLQYKIGGILLNSAPQ